MTITAFKRELAKTLGQKMAAEGFTGSGVRYSSETDQFLFVLAIEGNELEQFNVNFGIQPKAITHMGDFQKHNFSKIIPADCELGKMLIHHLEKPFWNLPARKEEVEQIAREMFNLVQEEAMPIVQKFRAEPDIFDKIDLEDITNPGIIGGKLGGVALAGMPIRTAWMLAIFYEQLDPNRARAFAQRGLECRGEPSIEISEEIKELMAYGLSGSVLGSDPGDESFFGMPDLKRITAM